MLFLLKRTWRTALPALLVLAALGGAGRFVFPGAPPIDFTPRNVGLGILVVVGVLASDGFIHLTCCRAFGQPYRERHAELAATFRGQTYPAILVGALMAGVGEELVFRGWGTNGGYLVGAAVAFGALHHVRRRLWPFAIWAGYQGLLFALALSATGALAVTMTAHFLHDLIGFLIFRRLNGPAREGEVAGRLDPPSSAPGACGAAAPPPG